eukprot:864666-Prorocentrum_lima.AAC.1
MRPHSGDILRPEHNATEQRRPVATKTQCAQSPATCCDQNIMGPSSGDVLRPKHNATELRRAVATNATELRQF